MIERINHILFATDFSDEADHALSYALEIAYRMNAELILFHSYRMPYDFASRSQRMLEKKRDEIQGRFNEIISYAKGHGRYHNVELRKTIRTGKTASTILFEANSEAVDLIVMGYGNNFDTSELRKVLFGNTTSEVVLSSEVPVLAVPESTYHNDFKEIIFTTNYYKSDLKVLNFIASFANSFDSEVKVVHTDPKDTEKARNAFKDFRKSVVEAISSFQFDFKHLTGEEYHEQLKKYIQQKKPGLLIMGRKKRNLLQYIFTMGEAEELAFCSDVPLLVIPWE